MKELEKNQPKVLSRFNTQEISRLEASANYTYLIKNDGTRVLSAYSLNVFQDLFETQDFIRVDRSNMIHRSSINSVNQSDQKSSVLLKDNTKITIPRKKAHSL